MGCAQRNPSSATAELLASIQPGAGRRCLWPPALRAAGDQLAGLVMRDAPGAVLADEQIAGDERAAALSDLARIGYCVSAATEQVALAAFQRRFRPERWDGLLDAETCARLAEVRMAVEAAQAAEEQRRRARFN